MFSLVFVSVKLNGEHGKPPFAFPGGETLLADGFSPELSNSHRVTFWLPDPSAWDPRTPLLPRRGEWAALAPGPSPGSTWTWGWWRRPSLRSVLRELPQTWFVAFLTPIGKTKQPRALSQSLIGLIQTKPQQAFAFLSFITFILIWTRSLDFKVAWLYCCHLMSHCTAITASECYTHLARLV